MGYPRKSSSLVNYPQNFVENNMNITNMDDVVNKFNKILCRCWTKLGRKKSLIQTQLKINRII